MKHTNFKLFYSKCAALIMCGILSMFGMVGTASAECVVDKTSEPFDPADPSVFTLLIDASSSCDALSDNMYGCDIDSTTGKCTIEGPDEKEIVVSLDEGSVGGTAPVRWSSTGDGQVDFVIIVGANNGGSCGTSYSPGSDFGKGLGFLKNNDSTQKMNSVSVCSDFEQPEEEVVISAEICPDNYQDAVNQLSETTGLDYAFLQDPNQGSNFSVCAPNGDPDQDGVPTPGVANTIRVACDDQCLTKPECEDPTDENGIVKPECAISVCESSGAWTAWTSEVGQTSTCSLIDNPAPGLPYCYEVQQDLNKDCTLNEWDPQEETVLTIKKGHVNPYVWQSCYTSGGRYVCETMCYLFPGDPASSCPPGSTVF